MTTNETIKLNATLKRETEKAFLMDCETDTENGLLHSEIWFPKSRTQLCEGGIEIESWLYNSLMFLDKMEEVCLFEASQASSGGASVDPKTGEVTRDGASNNKVRLLFIRTALNAREMKMKLMLDTGIIPREADKQNCKRINEEQKETAQ